MDRTTKSIAYIVIIALIIGVLMTPLYWFTQLIVILALFGVGGVLKKQF